MHLFSFAIGLAHFSIVLIHFFDFLNLFLLGRLFLFFILFLRVQIIIVAGILPIVFRVCLELLLADFTSGVLGLDVNLFAHFVEPRFGP